MENYYSILGVSNNAKENEIKQAYRQLSFQYHPDKNGGDKVKEEQYKKINEAYDTLKDSAKRKQYDYEICMMQSPSLAGESELHDILGQLFGGMNPRKSKKNNAPMFNPMEDMMFMSFSPGMSPGMGPGMGPSSMFQSQETCIEDINHTVQITYQQAYDGINMPITISRDITLGNHNYEEDETLYVNIPKGVDHNEIITISQKGHIKDKQQSNVKVHIELLQDAQFQRQGIDLKYVHKISFKESILGFSFVLEHLNGQHIKINNPKGKIILNKSTKIVKQLGFSRGESCGNLILEFQINQPEPLTTEQIVQYENIFELKK